MKITNFKVTGLSTLTGSCTGSIKLFYKQGLGLLKGSWDFLTGVVVRVLG